MRLGVRYQALTRLCHAGSPEGVKATRHALAFVKEVTIARLVELEVAGLVSQPQVVGIADGCLCARTGLHQTH